MMRMRRLVRGIGAVVTFAVAKIWNGLCTLIPPRMKHVERQWREQQRKQMACHAPDPTDRLLLALPPVANAAHTTAPYWPDAEKQNGKNEPLRPSKQRLLRRVRLRWVTGMMTACALGITVCLSIAIFGMLWRVSDVSFEGHAHYDEQALRDMLPLSEGDELLSYSTDDLEHAMLSRGAYLKTVRVTRSLRGELHISVTERVPTWVWIANGESIVILDDECTVLALDTTLTDSSAGLCRVLLPSDAEITVGGRLDEASLLSVALAALTSVRGSLHSDLMLLDATDPYALTLTLRDNTRIFLRGEEQLSAKLSAAAAAIAQYRTVEILADGEYLEVDVGEIGRTIVRKKSIFGQ